MKEVPAPTIASAGGPQTHSQKRLALMDEEEEEESKEPSRSQGTKEGSPITQAEQQRAQRFC